MTDRKRAPDEDDPKGYWEFEAVRNTRTSCDWLGQAQGNAFRMVHLLLADLPPEQLSFVAKRRGVAGSRGNAGFIRQDPQRVVELPDEPGVPVAACECTLGDVWS